MIIEGGRDSAVSEALHLHNIGVEVTLIHRRDALRAQEHLSKNLFQNNIPVIFNTELRQTRGEGRVEEVELYDNQAQKTTTLKTDGVFIAIGYVHSEDLAQKIGLELTPEVYIKRDARHRTSVPGIYSAGDVEGGYKQTGIAAGQGAEPAMFIFEDLMNPYWKKIKKLDTF